MAKEKVREAEPETGDEERQEYIPKPPSPEAVQEISRQQALITDEWAGEKEPEEAGRSSA